MPAREKIKQEIRRILTQINKQSQIKRSWSCKFHRHSPGGILERLLRNKDLRAIDRLTFRVVYMGGIYNKI